MTDRECMLRAIELAKQCTTETGKVSPKVGAVVMRDGIVLGEAYRGEMRAGDHAEYTVLEKKLADTTLAGATLFTTLEPCTSRHETTIPCVDRIIERRLGKVFIGVIDPNKSVKGEGELRLREGGVQVARFDSDLMSIIEELNRDFTRQHRPAGRSGAKELLSVPDQESIFDDPRLWYALSTRERTTYDELLRQNPSLAGLFLFGLQLTARANHFGVPYMIAHCGRELCKGVVHLLAGTEPLANPTDDTEKVDKDTDAFATLAGRAFGYPKETQIVREWAELQIYFNAVAHLRRKPPDGNEASRNFLRLTELTFGVIAPYFVTHQELQRILTIEVPTDVDEVQVRTILSRPTLRRLFFMSLQHPGWIERLRSLGVFDSPPVRNAFPDGSWSPVAWPEGEYLVRIAKRAPLAVAQILSAVPTSIDNPVVWDVAARGALELPFYDPLLTRKVTEGIKSIPYVVIDEGIRKLARRAATEHDENCFVLLDALLSVAGGQ